MLEGFVQTTIRARRHHSSASAHIGCLNPRINNIGTGTNEEYFWMDTDFELNGCMCKIPGSAFS